MHDTQHKKTQHKKHTQIRQRNQFVSRINLVRRVPVQADPLYFADKENAHNQDNIGDISDDETV